jgi:hypothetical protein
LLLLLENNKSAMRYALPWYEERMLVLESYRIESRLDNKVLSKNKLKKF